MAIPGNVGMRKSTFSSPAAMAQAQRAADAQSMKALQDRREQTRQDFFKGRPDISDNRLDRRQIQKDLMDQFRDTQMRDVIGATGLKQSVVPGGKTMADRSMELARMYGPTLREIGSDIGYGLGNLARGFGDFIGKGGVIGNVISDVYNRFKGGAQQGIETVKDLYDNLRTTLSDQPTVTTGGSSSMITTINEQPRVDLTPTELSMYNDMSPSEMGVFNRKINEGSTPREALAYVRKVNSGYYLGNYPELMQMDYPFLPSVLKTSSNVPTTAELPSDFQMKQKPLIPDQFRNIGDESDPSIFGITNTGVPLPFLRSTVDLPYNNISSFNPDTYQPGYLPEGFSSGGSVDKYAGLGYKLK